MARGKITIVYKQVLSGFSSLLNFVSRYDLSKPVRYLTVTYQLAAGALTVYSLIASSRSRKQARVELARAVAAGATQGFVIWWNAQLSQWWYEQLGNAPAPPVG